MVDDGDVEDDGFESNEDTDDKTAGFSSLNVENDMPDASSIVRHHGDTGQAVPLWLITFTDVMALMLTFFVLLYSMSVPVEEKWQNIVVSLSSKFNYTEAKPHNAGSQDVISIDKIDTSRALSLVYLKTLVKSLLKENGIDNVIVFENDKRLIISLPSELLFASGRAEIKIKGKKILFALGGALARVRNRIEIAGHTDPRPITGTKGPYRTNWELSLARSASVAVMLKDVGYMRDITLRGLSSARFDEMSDSAPEEERYNLSRRVDIVVMNDDGVRTKFYGLQ